jgi:hypothetical protein
MASSATIIEWLKEAGAYAEKREDLVGISGMLIESSWGRMRLVCVSGVPTNGSFETSSGRT